MTSHPKSWLDNVVSDSSNKSVIVKFWCKFYFITTAFIAAFLAFSGAGYLMNNPVVIFLNQIQLIYWLFLYLYLYIENRFALYARTKEWMTISGRFLSIKIFIFCLSITAVLANIPIPEDLLSDNRKVVLIFGGSAALYYVGLASTPLEKEVCLNLFFFSTILLKIAGHTEIFLSILLFLPGLLLLPKNFLFLVVLLSRFFLFADYGPALFCQTCLVYAFRKWRYNHPLLLGAAYLTMVLSCCLWHGLFKVILFPLSGALAIFFFFLATSGKEYCLTAILYLVNQLILCFFTENKEAAIYIICIYTVVLVFFMILTRIRQNTDQGYDQKVSQFWDDFLLLIKEGKMHIFLMVIGPIFLLLPVSGVEPWVRPLSETLFLQFSFIHFIQFIFQSVGPSRGTG